MTRYPPAAQAAVDKYVEFHRFDPRELGTFCCKFSLPETMYRAGRAKYVMYRSGKVDPASLKKPKRPINYIHEHDDRGDSGVTCYLPTLEDADGPQTDVPERFRNVEALTRLGSCLGFGFEDENGELCEAEGRDPLPDLYTTPDGHCLLVIQSRKKILAMMWGGSLGVFARGIDG
jgi:hypothetical protein